LAQIKKQKLQEIDKIKYVNKKHLEGMKRLQSALVDFTGATVEFNEHKVKIKLENYN
jgi:hypothetical protein